MHTALDYGQDGEWEPQRLSVIDEGINLQSSQRWQTATGNERIYSALVKRLDDMSKQQTSENHTESTHGTQDSEALYHGKHDTRSSFYTRDDDDVFRDAEKSPQFCCSGTQPVSLDEAVTKWKAETASAGPPGSPETVTSVSNYLFRTQSPYKRALRQSINASNEEQHRAINVRYLSSLSALSLPTRRPTPDNTEGDFRLTSAESVYSRSSDNETILLGHNQEGEQQPQDIGAEELCDNGSSSPTQAHLREVSSASSVEWKTWLSANVSKLEAGTGSKEFADAQAWNPWITIGHVREQAEIEPILCQSRLSSQASISSCDYIDNAETMKTDSIKQNANQHAKPTFSEAAPQQTLDENKHPASANRSKGIYECNDGHENNTAASPGNVLRAVSSLPNVRRNKATDSPRYWATPQASCGKKVSGEWVIDEEAPHRTALSPVKSGPGSSAKSTPGLTAAVTRQFGTASTGSPRRRGGRYGMDPKMAGVSPHQRSISGGVSDAQVMGSKRMVELFLSSRRNKIAGNGSERSVSASSAAFI
ncbi:hypothetical protein K4F52_008207 [Lecanicillium sp. MT-2017a]|nr:hypothetical protein K4F52_008207 [Lecanicillium sp. MT-2017a]